MKAQTLVLFLVALTILGTGCAKKKRDKAQVRVRGADTLYTPGGGTPTPGQPFSKSLGEITNFQGNGDFLPVIKLVSATMEDTEEGMRLPVHGIAMNGEIRLNGSTQNIRALGSSQVSVTTGSQLAIFILDDMTVNDGAGSITISFAPGYDGYQVSGTVGGGQAQLTFHDNFGDIFVQGNYNTNSYTGNFTGTVTFRNSTGAYAGQTVQLGNFSVPVCGFFHCQ